MSAQATVITVTMNTAIDRLLSAPGFEVGAHLRAEPISLTPAGKGINLSRALARLGRSNIATGYVGQAQADRFEQFLRSGEAFGRVNNQLLTVMGPTRENITIVDPQTGTDTHLRTHGYALSEQDLARLSTKIGLLSREGVVFVFAGSLPEGMDDPALLSLVRRAQTGGASVVLDLNGKTLGSLLNSLDEPVLMISPNRTELAEAVGHEGELDDAALLDFAKRLKTRSGWVLVSLGADGGLLLTPDGLYRGRCEVDADKIVSTVGSGDCLVAAVLDAKLHAYGPEEALKHGLAVASASTLSADPSGFDMKTVRELMQTVEVIKD